MAHSRPGGVLIVHGDGLAAGNEPLVRQPRGIGAPGGAAPLGADYEGRDAGDLLRGQRVGATGGDATGKGLVSYVRGCHAGSREDGPLAHAEGPGGQD